MSDDRPPCTLLPPPAISTCSCSARPGCQWPPADDECEHCRNPLCDGDCQDDLMETYPGSGIYE